MKRFLVVELDKSGAVSHLHQRDDAEQAEAAAHASATNSGASAFVFELFATAEVLLVSRVRYRVETPR